MTSGTRTEGAPTMRRDVKGINRSVNESLEEFAKSSERF